MPPKKRRVAPRKRRPAMHPVVVQVWVESERGMGVRPDGYSLHQTMADLKAFIREYWDNFPDQVPDAYSRPLGEPYLADVDPKTFAQVRASKNGIDKTGTPPKAS